MIKANDPPASVGGFPHQPNKIAAALAPPSRQRDRMPRQCARIFKLERTNDTR